MGAVVEIAIIQVPLLLIVCAAATTVVWWRHERVIFRRIGSTVFGDLRGLALLAFVAVWLALTLVSWWCVFLWAYLTMLGMYVLFGAVGGWAALAGATLLSVGAPLFWGAIVFGLVRRQFRYAPAPRRVGGAFTDARALPH